MESLVRSAQVTLSHQDMAQLDAAGA
jgi:hypothetical protein